LERVRAALPRLASMSESSAARSVRLADVQHALAREAGVENWAALKALVQSQEPLIAQVARFCRALLEYDLAAMRRVLGAFPVVVRTSIHAACAACDMEAVEAWIARDPAHALARSHDTGLTPIESVAASAMFRVGPARREASVAI